MGSLRKRFYIIFVSRQADGRLRKIPVPLHYAYVFAAAAIVGAFTLAGMAGSYSRMMLKTANFEQVSSQREALREDYQQLEVVAQQNEVQVASLGSLASEVSALYGLRQNRLGKSGGSVVPIPADSGSNFNDEAYTESFDELSALRTTALAGHFSRALTPAVGRWASLVNAPSLWPVTGRITSSFGEREDPFNGEGAFHAGIDIAATYGQPVRATADGVVLKAAFGNGYGREVMLDHGNGIETLYGHLSGFAVTAGERVTRGQVIGYVGTSGRSTGPHLHYEVRIHDTPVNPHRYMRQTMNQLAAAAGESMSAGS
ncbi:MAG TPA: M23 family metallopeptidase [Silvibacterium sp.]|nr:M23 family metallopeptidase [Silvibacterium sp.]